MEAEDKESGADTGREKHRIVANLVQKWATGKVFTLAEKEAWPYDIRFCMDSIPEEPPESPFENVNIEAIMAWQMLCGHPDLVIVDGDDINVYDWKMGWASDRAEAFQHRQGMGYAVCAADVFEKERVEFHLVCPNHPERESRHTIAEYCKRELQQARAAISAIHDRAHSENAKRKPSIVACQYCDARGTEYCPESMALVKQTAALTIDVPNIPTKDLLELMDAAKVAQAISKAILDEGKARLISGEMPEGEWGLKAGAKTHQFSGTFDVWNRVKDKLGSDKVERTRLFLDACKPSYTDLLKAFKTASGLKGGAAEEVFQDLLAESHTIKENAPSLVRKAARLELTP